MCQYNKMFSHVYVEKGVAEHPRTKQILEKLNNTTVIEIDHYKDVFCRKKQSISAQSNAKALILAENTSGCIYEGAPVCQSFGNENFYYCSCMMNCIFDCEYCYLKGMYPSGNLVVFVNLEDIFAELEALLAQKSIYLCVSYDADLVAIESLTGFVREWIAFTKKHENLTIEIRTKSGRCDLLSNYEACDRVIIAYTVSPQRIAAEYEHFASAPMERIQAAKCAMDSGFPVRLCFDPMIYCKDWRGEYSRMVGDVFSQIDGSKLWDVSIGSFRISQDYLKKMRKDMPCSAVVNFPYDNVNGYYQYPENIRSDMEEFMIQAVSEYVDKDRIFMWKCYHCNTFSIYISHSIKEQSDEQSNCNRGVFRHRKSYMQAACSEWLVGLRNRKKLRSK